MIKYSVRSVVCDYGVYENDRLIVICERYSNALLVADILNFDLQTKGLSDFSHNSSESEQSRKILGKN